MIGKWLDVKMSLLTDVCQCIRIGIYHCPISLFPSVWSIQCVRVVAVSIRVRLRVWGIRVKIIHGLRPYSESSTSAAAATIFNTECVQIQSCCGLKQFDNTHSPIHSHCSYIQSRKYINLKTEKIFQSQLQRWSSIDTWAATWLDIDWFDLD